ncbi:3-hydroxyisobutyrate dehydrogenase/putative dehydrogenase [Humitalea rosea]|uniref:L-threonate dehydrogenase n=1 Tax=Humitalea rosea TaxID=990373 RepID=A0A2W7I7I8_9PROT|nr:L-threonate dehydrogenase [Humitalea rosea]PZW42128.1 3-hydroxyisobutyrate dehydrogenase/putative dehydrogenase [Humitalea rosea]
MQVGVIGLGSMGMGAALNLLRAPGLEVTGVDPRQIAQDAFIAAGGKAVGRAADLPAGQQAVLVLVVNAAQARAALFGPEGAAGSLAPGCVCIVSSTMAPVDARALAEEAARRGLLYLDAPVSGGATAATAGTMTVMASGSQAAFDAARPVLDAVAKRVFDMGREPGLGTTMKVVHQLLAGVHIAAAAEAMALGLKAGIEAQTLYDVVVSAAGNSWMFENRMQHVLDGNDTPTSAVDIFVKDLGLVTDLARAESLPVPLAAQAQQLFTAARGLGQGAKDDAFVIRVWEALAGITLPKAP